MVFNSVILFKKYDTYQLFLNKIDPIPSIFGREKLRQNSAIGIALGRISYLANSQRDKIHLGHVVLFKNSILIATVPQRALIKSFELQLNCKRKSF